MTEKIEYNFMGRIKYVYELFESRYLVDKLVLMERKDQEVIDRAKYNFNAVKRSLILKLNGEIVYVFSNNFRMILNTENGVIYKNLIDMADNEGMSLDEAKNALKIKFKYKYLNNDQN